MESVKESILFKLERMGKLLGYLTEREWSPTSLKGKSRQNVYIPKIDLIWYKPVPQSFKEFIEKFKWQGTLDPYRDYEKEIIIGFELELTDRPTKYILGDISNLSRLCNYGFIVIKNIENLVNRSVKASKAFSVLHGASNVFIIDINQIDDLLKWAQTLCKS